MDSSSSSDSSDMDETMDSADKDNLGFLAHTSLKPKLESILGDVAQSLPDIDFNSGSDDDTAGDSGNMAVEVFQREISAEPPSLRPRPGLVQQQGLLAHQLLDEPPPLESFDDDDPDKDTVDEISMPVEMPPLYSSSSSSLLTPADDLEPELAHLRDSDDECDRPDRPARLPLRQNWMDATGDPVRGGRRKEESSWEHAERMVSRFFPASSHLTMPRLTETVNMDTILDCVSRGEPIPEIDNSLLGDLPAQRTQGLSPFETASVLEKLAAMSSRVSGQNLDLDPRTGASVGGSDNKDTEERQEIPKIVHRPPPTTSSQPSTSTSSVQVRETIFLDLRADNKNTRQEREKMETIQRILKLEKAQNPEPDSTSSGDSDDDGELWFEQRRRLKQAISTGTSTADLPAASTTGAKVQRTYKKPETPKYISARTKQPTPPKRETETETRVEDETETRESESESKVEVATDDEKDVDESETMKILRQREREMSERQTRQRLAKQLEDLRPVTTPGGLPVARNTGTLFHVDVSYEPPLETLPPDMGARELCLLTVNLTSNSSIVTHRNGKIVDSDLGLSGSYTSLVTWLLSLVPAKPLDQSHAKNVPTKLFHVVGIQQMYFHDKLCLYVAVTPTDPAIGNQKPKKGKGREELTLFQQQLNKYLSSRTLTEAAPWLAALFPQEIAPRQSYRDNARENRRYAYRPPLPLVSSKPLSTYLNLNPDPSATERVFSQQPGFYWTSMDSKDSRIDVETKEFDFQTTMSLLKPQVFRNPISMTGVFNRLLQDGMDLCGLRLVHDAQGPEIALALRGKRARSLWLDAVGPSDPVLARKTDPHSLIALYGGEEKEGPIYCPRNPSRVQQDLVRYFAARVPKNGSVNVGKRQVDGVDDVIAPATLTCTVGSDVAMMTSLLVPRQWMGVMLMVCAERGFQLCGVRQMVLSKKRANILGLSPEQQQYYRCWQLEDAGSVAVKPCTVLLLRRENALTMAGSLVEAFMVQLALKGLLGPIHRQAGLDLPSTDVDERNASLVTSSMLFNVIPYSETALAALGGNFYKVSRHLASNSVSVPGYIAPRLVSSPELDQVAVLALTGWLMMENAGVVIASLLNLGPSSTQLSSPYPGMELLGIRWLPRLSPHQAKLLTPYEAGRPNWKKSLQTLQTEPALVLLLRAVDVFRKLYDFCGLNKPRSNNQLPLDKLVSPTPELAYDYLTLFFDDREIFPDAEMQELRDFLPNEIKLGMEMTSQSDVVTSYGEMLRRQLLRGHQELNSVLVVKPDGVKKHLIKIMKRLDQSGYQVVASRLAALTPNQAHRLTANEPERAGHLSHLTSGVSLLVVVRRVNAVKKLVDLLGHAEPDTARRHNQLSWRALYGTNSVCNALYCSPTYEKAVSDMELLFPNGLCAAPTPDLAVTRMACLGEDDVMDSIPRTRTARRKPDSSSGDGVLSSASAHHVSFLLETSCVVMRGEMVRRRGEARTSPCVTVLTALTAAGCEIVGMRMVHMTEQQADVTLHLYQAGTLNLVPELTSEASLVVAFHGQNAVLSFERLLGGSISKDSLYNKYKDFMLVPNDQKQALDCVAYFFDELTPEAMIEVSSRDQTVDR